MRRTMRVILARSGENANGNVYSDEAILRMARQVRKAGLASVRRCWSQRRDDGEWELCADVYEDQILTRMIVTGASFSS